MRALAALVLLVAVACSGGGDGEARGKDAGGAEAGLDAGKPDASEAGDAGEAGEADAPAVEAEAAVDAGVTCKEVAHIGDSLSAYTVDPLTQAYAKVGVSAEIDAYGGRAIKQKLPADPKTGKQAALDFVAAGFAGCWVVALGTNDTANVAAGAWYTRAEAIDEMMDAIDPSGTAPVMWVNTFTTKTTGYWSNANMQLWNEALADAKSRWPNLKVFDWAAIAVTGGAPFSDGIHHTSAGYAVRNEAIAGAFAGYFPTDG